MKLKLEIEPKPRMNSSKADRVNSSYTSFSP